LRAAAERVIVGQTVIERTVKRVQQEIDRLKIGLDAIAVAILDNSTGHVFVSTAEQATRFRRTVDELKCLDIDWRLWQQDLWTNREHELKCGCPGRHQLYGLVIHDPVVLLILAKTDPVPGVRVAERTLLESQAEMAFSTSILILEYLLVAGWPKSDSDAPGGAGAPVRGAGSGS
jgi:hypothetical protein